MAEGRINMDPRERLEKTKGALAVTGSILLAIVLLPVVILLAICFPALILVAPLVMILALPVYALFLLLRLVWLAVKLRIIIIKNNRRMKKAMALNAKADETHARERAE